MSRSAFPQELSFPVTAPGVLHPETANQLTHALGFGLSLVGGAALLSWVEAPAFSQSWWGCAIYAATLIALYAASTLSHSFQDTARRAFFRLCDQICIFLLVLGNYLAFGLTHLNEGGWRLLTVAMLVLAIVGIAARIRTGHERISVPYYLAMGWLPVLATGKVLEIGQWQALGLVLAGGLAYTVGIWFLVNDRRHPYFHAIWHLATIAGSFLHYVFVLEYVACWTA